MVERKFRDWLRMASWQITLFRIGRILRSFLNMLISHGCLPYSALESHVSVTSPFEDWADSVLAFHSVDSCELKPGQWLAVIGAGGLGQLATQYAKAMNLKVVAIDINNKTLEVCKEQGADAAFNSMTNKNYVEQLKKLTGGGAHAAAVYSEADAAYAHAKDVLRLGGTLMMVGLPKNPVAVVPVEVAIGLYKIKGESTSIPQRMQKAVDFTLTHTILPEIEFRKFEDVQSMIDDMSNHRSTKRMAVQFS
jgi:propanol-preferring alcohol dehydrogenase